MAYPAQLQLQSSKLESNVNPNTLASAAGTVNAITYGVTKVSGTAAITALQVPSGFRGAISLIPTAAFTGATGGTYASDGTTDTIPIGLAFTAVIGRVLTMVTDGLLWYPSYTN